MPTPVAAIDNYISTEARLQTFSGTVLIAQNGKVVLEKAYGWADKGKRLPNVLTTRFGIGSITKQFTAMAILLLQDRGKLSVQDPVCQYIGGCPETWKVITLSSLLAHTSGIPDYLRSLSISQPLPAEQLLSYLERQPLDFAPGSEFRYSNSGYAILGFVIEKLSGQTYSEFVGSEILKPLHMNSSGDIQSSAAIPQLAIGYYDAWDKAPPVNGSPLFAAGNLYSTVDDLYRWDTAVFNDKFASRTALNQMFTPHATYCDAAGDFCGPSECAADLADCSSYGYGWFLQSESVGKGYIPLISHSGGIPGFVTYNSYYPNQHLTFIALSNLEAFGANIPLMAHEVESDFFTSAA